ncbi:MAG: deoxyribose-phosphate aldolase [Bacteroidales bacterium]|nr:deoxyribose-phosphate aldolase [Bacteroidales bacterium]MBR5567256.1 deoxyribose-phosphate aldolase [Bacteroidales bacterium]MBR5861940.1 deoxyribose-phosphate aldolase [Bacteroidales bacterium]
MAEYLTKYGYAPDQESMGRALEMIAANLESVASEQVYKECFSMMDLTTLKTDDTPESVLKLVNKVNSFNQSYPEWPLPASICVYSNFAATVKEARTCDFNITVVSACFPSSQSFLEVKLRECELAVEQGADEVDIVLALNAFLAGNYEAAAEEIRQVRKVIDEVAERQGRKVHLKVILETGLLRTPEKIAEASFLAMEAGADFIKTSTGKVDVNATPAAAYVMCECIAKYYEMTGKKIGFKPAGGISSAADALCYYSIVSGILGKEWLNKDLFRFGVSRVANSLLAAVEQKTVSFF